VAENLCVFQLPALLKPWINCSSIATDSVNADQVEALRDGRIGQHFQWYSQIHISAIIENHAVKIKRYYTAPERLLE